MQLNENITCSKLTSKKRKLKSVIVEEESKTMLPIDNLQTEIINAIFSHKTTIVLGETGSGKSTRLPVFIHRYLMTRGGGNMKSIAFFLFLSLSLTFTLFHSLMLFLSLRDSCLHSAPACRSHNDRTASRSRNRYSLLF